MATYKVPQDVEADDKLLGPFTFRQFVYLMIVFGLIMLTIGLFRLFPLLAIIPLPFIFFFAVLALPLKKDQPMETYFAALLSFYTKPNKRYFVPGLSESTILITAPKKSEPDRVRNLSEDEANHRLSFLAELVDSEGHAIKNASTTMKDDFYAEAYNTTDMFEHDNNYGLENVMIQDQQERRGAVIDQMRNAIETSDYNYDNGSAGSESAMPLPGERIVQPRTGFTGINPDFTPSGAPATLSGFESPSVVQPIYSAPESTPPPTPNIAPSQPLENVQEVSDRIRKENESEVYVSLH